MEEEFPYRIVCSDFGREILGVSQNKYRALRLAMAYDAWTPFGEAWVETSDGEKLIPEANE